MHLNEDARILVISVARIGDTLLTTPAMAALKAAAPKGTLHVLAHPKRMPLLKHLAFIDHVGGITPLRARFLLPFAKPEFDLAIVYGHDRALLQYARRRAKHTVGFLQNTPLANSYLDTVVPGISTPGHAVKHRLMLSTAIGVTTADFRLRYSVAPQESEWASRWLNQHIGAGPIVGLQVASFATKSYRDWPLDHFVALIAALLARRPKQKFLILGDSLSRPQAQALVQQFPGKVFSSAGVFTLRENAAVIAALSLYIGVDTGPTHLAGALHVPMVGLYHCVHRGTALAPLQHPALEVVEHPAKLADRNAPMSDIAVTDVVTAVEKVWARSAEKLKRKRTAS